uniref:Peptide chain release factor-like protein n=1 Tax=candidate division WOR-3 bacterium TaxID=2052148 RepID=A0A7C4CCJ7_UNCW3
MRFGVSREKEVALTTRMARLGIREAELEERFIRSSGPGGQNVNKVETGVYLRHRPSGVEVKFMRERSQSLNRFLARRVLCDRVEALIAGRRSEEQARVAKLKRQKRKRSRRAKEKVLQQKKEQAEKKQLRREPAE